MNKETYLILNLLVSSAICLAMYLITAILFSYEGLLLHKEPVGVIALMAYFIFPFITISLRKIKE